MSSEIVADLESLTNENYKMMIAGIIDRVDSGSATDAHKAIGTLLSISITQEKTIEVMRGQIDDLNEIIGTYKEMVEKLLGLMEERHES